MCSLSNSVAFVQNLTFHCHAVFSIKPTKDTAVVNGIPPEPKETAMTSLEAQKLGVCVDCTNMLDKKFECGQMEPLWQIIDHDLEGQSAITIWRVLARTTLENARDHAVTTVELKPKTGRYHQLRRHMVSRCCSG